MQKPFIQIPASLIKYESPIPIYNLDEFRRSKNEQLKQGKAKVKGIYFLQTQKDILNALLPPREFEMKQNERMESHFIQYANSDRLKRQDVDILKQKLEGFLQVRKARNEPICPIRQKIFGQAFDQVIRQVILDNPQRGIVLSRVKNQLYMTIFTYCTLYQESLSFSRRKLTQSQGAMSQLQQQQSQLLTRQKQLDQKRVYLLSKKQSVQQKYRQLRSIHKQKREYQISALKFQELNFRKFLFIVNQNKQQDLEQNQSQQNIQSHRSQSAHDK